MRKDGRENDELREISITPGYTQQADGSVLVAFGATRVICTAMADDRVPPFLEGSGKGWLSAEYAMLPSATPNRKQRDVFKKDGRAVEISRLIGRALRQAVDLDRLCEKMIHIDCDVIQADGGTRTAAITGGYVALAIALHKMAKCGDLPSVPLKDPVSAVSAGIVHGEAMLDLCYLEDSAAQADMNVVMQNGAFIEIQGTGEQRAIEPNELSELLALCRRGIEKIAAIQTAAIERGI